MSLVAPQIPDISIVIVNRNAADFLRGCLRTISAAQGSLWVEVIIVDNGSKDDSLAVVSEFAPGSKVLVQDKNIGYVPANNLGLQVATGRYTMFLNNDTEMRPDCLIELIRFLDQNEDVGRKSSDPQFRRNGPGLRSTLSDGDERHLRPALRPVATVPK